jgi:hypothetical protein
MCVIGVCEFCCDGEDSVFSAMVMILRRAGWDLVLLAMLWSPSSDGCGEDCSPVTSSPCIYFKYTVVIKYY